MVGLVALMLASYALLFAFAVAAPASALRSSRSGLDSRASSIDAWIDSEYTIATNRLLDNISPSGANAQGAAPGTVLASPSKSNPDYYYQCEIPS